MSRSKKSPTTRRKSKSGEYTLGILKGFAVTFAPVSTRYVSLAPIKGEGKPVVFDDGLYRTEFWAYDPALLNEKQRKVLRMVAWKKIDIDVKVNDRG